MHPYTPPFYCILECSLLASVQTLGDKAEGQAEARIKHVFMAFSKNSRQWRKPHSKFSILSMSR
jgi:hypothetical protein